MKHPLKFSSNRRRVANPPSFVLRQTALERLAQFVESPVLSYAQTRNYDYGPSARGNVSCLSPYIRNRVITEEEVVQAVLQQHSYSHLEKFVQEVFWRTYWKGWLEMRPAVWSRYCEEWRRLQVEWGEHPDYLAACKGTTGIECLDTWVHELIETGYLHNHTRMWFASIWIFTLKLPWQLGAHLFMRYLLDGDPASNTLSWRWVAGLHTRGKHYAARESNIAKYTQGRFSPRNLNEDTEPLTEDWPVPEPELTNLNDSGCLTGKRFGLIVTDDDVAIDQAWQQSCVQVMGFIDKKAYSAHRIVPAVFQHRYDSLKQSVESWATNSNIESVVTDQPSTEQILQWAVVGNLECVALTQPTVGLSNGFIIELNQQLAASGIELITLRKPWDERLFPYAKKGFFSFKKIIPEIVEEIRL